MRISKLKWMVTSAILSFGMDHATAEDADYIISDRDHIDFGTVKQGVSGKNPVGVFHLKNAGEKTVRIRDVTGSCGCTALTIDRKVLKPDEMADLKGEIRMDGLFGQKEVKIAVRFSDGSYKILSLKVAVQSIARTMPGLLSFVLPQTGDRSIKFEVYLPASSVLSSGPKIDYGGATFLGKCKEETTYLKSVDNADVVCIRISCRLEEAASEFSGFIKIVNAKTPLNLPVKVAVKPDLSLARDTVVASSDSGKLAFSLILPEAKLGTEDSVSVELHGKTFLPKIENNPGKGSNVIVECDDTGDLNTSEDGVLHITRQNVVTSFPFRIIKKNRHN